jgi:hypothetical protein
MALGVPTLDVEGVVESALSNPAVFVAKVVVADPTLLAHLDVVSKQRAMDLATVAPPSREAPSVSSCGQF